MCGVIGISLTSVTPSDLELVKRVFIESMIRGKHATGVSFVKNRGIVTIKNGVSVTEFLKTLDLNDCINEDGGLYMIGHIRYSTSDIRYNQPFSNGNISIVHNGVISQEDPAEWPYKCETSNDSEMILKCIEDGDHPLQTFHDKSLAVCKINSGKVLNCYRNHERPLWYTELDNGVIFTSTKNIAVRAGLSNPVKCEMFVSYNYDGMWFNDTMNSNGVEDLQ